MVGTNDTGLHFRTAFLGEEPGLTYLTCVSKPEVHGTHYTDLSHGQLVVA